MGRTDTRISRTTARAAACKPASPQGPSDDSVRAYLNEIDRYPILSAEQERELGERVRRGDKAARRTLIESNLRLVVVIARTYRTRHLTLLDLIGEGNVGLMAAVDHYDPARGTRFATMAGWWIRQGMSRSLPAAEGVLHHFDTSSGRRIAEYIAERMSAT